jgi:hypothetical protein
MIEPKAQKSLVGGVSNAKKTIERTLRGFGAETFKARLYGRLHELLSQSLEVNYTIRRRMQ